ncbi:amino acid adenylation domain-containing protein [Cellulosimicrobium cellulans]|uniref:non-ribosomal peptide synthetase n=1 Tax=Cellulosimicrobium cellulans TaxID=1710 RepID=UPI0036EA7687
MSKERNIVECFDAQADVRPGAPAVMDDTGTHTFGDLRSASVAAAKHLLSQDVRAGDVVGLVGPRGRDVLVGMLAILRVGAAYLPLDLSLPRDRLATMIEQAGCRVVFAATDAESIADLATVIDGRNFPALSDEAVGPVACPATADDLAYVMFTSGSTGVPKAVGIPHRGVVLLAMTGGVVETGPGRRTMHASTLSFDASTLEIWPTLLTGGCLVVVDSDMLLAPDALARHLREHAVETVFLTTSLLHHVARTAPQFFDGLDQVLTGGEALDGDMAAVVAARARRLVNCYGPTESTVMATAHVVREGATPPVPIGRPLPYVECLVVGSDGRAAATGEEGELWIGGGGLATGYLADPALTARRFVSPPAGTPTREQRFYRTGDRVRRRPDGAYEFRGRIDDQLKIRGFRIEPGEVEHALRSATGVQDAAVLATGEGVDRRLVAVVVPDDSVRLDTIELRRRLSTTLPAHMVPGEVHELPRLPLTVSGKVNRSALRRLAAEHHSPTEEVRAGDGSPEDVARDAWRVTLGLDRLDEDQDFFEAGGTSLRAAQLIARVQAALDLDGDSGYTLIRALLSQPRLTTFTATVRAVAAGAAAAPQAADRWRPDVHLPDVHTLPDAPARPAGHAAGDRVLLTGATGFFGSYLLRELLASTDAVVECVVRATDTASARRRIDEAQEKYGHGRLPATDRIAVLPGDLSAPHLGLAEDDFDALARRTDRIYHSAAHVNFVYPYEWLRPANVDGTRTLAELALRAGRVPVHYVSTIALLSGAGSAGTRFITESDPVQDVERISMGYPESKWVAEKILERAARQGVPVSVYRPYEITGSLADGRWNTDAAIVAFFKAIVDMGTAPDAALPLDFVPADYLARALVHLAEHTPSADRTFHLTNPRYGRLSEMVDRLRAHGHPVTTIDYDAWVRHLREFCADHPGHPIVSFLPLFTTPASGQDVTVKELYFEDLFPRFDRHHTETGLAGTGIDCPPVDTRMLDSYIDWFHRTGWIAPAASAEIARS